MKELIYEYGNLALSSICGGVAFGVILAAFFTEGGVFCELLTRCMAYWF